MTLPNNSQPYTQSTSQHQIPPNDSNDQTQQLPITANALKEALMTVAMNPTPTTGSQIPHRPMFNASSSTSAPSMRPMGGSGPPPSMHNQFTVRPQYQQQYNNIPQMRLQGQPTFAAQMAIAIAQREALLMDQYRMHLRRFLPDKFRSAISYLEEIKVRFSDRPEVYPKFVDTLVKYWHEQIDIPRAIQTIASVLKGEPSLISGFSMFLPPGFRIECKDKNVISVFTPASHLPNYYSQQMPPPPTIPPQTSSYHPFTSMKPYAHPQQQPKPTALPSQPNNSKPSSKRYDDAMELINKIKARFSDKPEVIKQFMAAIQELEKNENKPVEEILNHVAGILHNDMELVQGFKMFLGPEEQPMEVSLAEDTLTTNKSNKTTSSQDSSTINKADKEETADAKNQDFEPNNQPHTDPNQDILDDDEDYIGDEPFFDVQEDFIDPVPDEESNVADTQNVVTDAQPSSPEQKAVADAHLKKSVTESEQLQDKLQKHTNLKRNFVSHLPSDSKSKSVDNHQLNTRRNSVDNLHLKTKQQTEDKPYLNLKHKYEDTHRSTIIVQLKNESEAEESPVEEKNTQKVEHPKAIAQPDTALKTPNKNDVVTKRNSIDISTSSRKRHIEEETGSQNNKRRAVDTSSAENIPVSNNKSSDTPSSDNITPRPEHDQMFSLCTIMNKRRTLPVYKAPSGPVISEKGIKLFERIRKCINNRQNYHEFLKMLNLYTQEIFDLDTLVGQAEKFIGKDRMLFKDFTEILGGVPTTVDKPQYRIKPDISSCAPIKDSPSYRVVPKEWRKQLCSGRDKLASEVLNDEYASCPSLTREDGGAVVSTKSQYEEAMYACEDDRYLYSMMIDANLHTIELLQSVSRRMESMTADERKQFKLQPGLGGQSKTIYQRVIKYVYGDKEGADMIRWLYEKPAIVVPVILNRLMTKSIDWNKEEREMNRQLRQTEAKNYYKALDHQSHTTKITDRKFVAPKALVSEIEIFKTKRQTAEGTGEPLNH